MPVDELIEASEEGEGDDPDLVMAMPRRELYAIRGFTGQVSMTVLESIADESWFAQEEVLLDDVDSKEVRLGLILCRDDERLVSEAGELVHTIRIPPDVGHLGAGLAAIRAFAGLTARQLLAVEVRPPQMLGYFNEDGLEETRSCFILVYSVAIGGADPAPAGFSWVPRSALTEIPLDAVSSLMIAELP